MPPHQENDAIVLESENDLIKVRLEKLERLRARGIDPYPRNYDRTHTTQQALSLFESAESQQNEDARTEERVLFRSQQD